jgi:hypothetical protein
MFNSLTLETAGEREEWKLKKFIEILLCSVQRFSTFPPAFSFILQFLEHLEVFCLHRFFQAICSNDPVYSGVQNWLVNQGFSVLVACTIDAVRVSKKSNTERLRSLLSLIPICRLSDRLSESFIDVKVIEVLNMDFVGLDDSVLDDVWSAICAVYTADTALLFRGLYPSAVEAITSDFGSIRRFRIYAIDVLTSMLLIDEVLRPFIIEAKLGEAIVRLFARFPGHTFLQTAVARLVEAALGIRGVREELSVPIIGGVLSNLREIDSHMSMAVLCEIVELAINVGSGDKMFLGKIRGIPGFDGFIEGPFKARNKVIKNGYGGKVPILKGMVLRIYDVEW